MTLDAAKSELLRVLEEASSSSEEEGEEGDDEEEEIGKSFHLYNNP